MGRPLYTNNAATYLAFGITNTATTMQVSANAGGLFPNPVGGNYFYVSLISLSGPIIEIVKCTARNGDIFTIERGQEGTTPLYWNTGDNVQLRITAASLNLFASESNAEEDLAAYKAAVASSTGSSLVGYNEGNTGAVTRTVQSRLRDLVSVKDFGATGDGTTDDTSAIQTAFNAGVPLFFPPGTYKTTSTTTHTGSVYVVGESATIKSSTLTFKFTDASNSFIKGLNLIPSTIPYTLKPNAVTWVNTASDVVQSYEGFLPNSYLNANIWSGLSSTIQAQTTTNIWTWPTIWFYSSSATANTNVEISEITGHVITIALDGYTNSTVRDCNFSGGTALGSIMFNNGFARNYQSTTLSYTLARGQNNKVVNNNVQYGGYSNIWVRGNDQFLIQGNTSSWANETGIKLDQADGSTGPGIVSTYGVVDSNISYNNYNDGIDCGAVYGLTTYYPTYCVFSNNQVINNKYAGMISVYGSNATYTGNQISFNGNMGLQVSGQNCVVTGNLCNQNAYHPELFPGVQIFDIFISGDNITSVNNHVYNPNAPSTWNYLHEGAPGSNPDIGQEGLDLGNTCSGGPTRIAISPNIPSSQFFHVSPDGASIANSGSSMATFLSSYNSGAGVECDAGNSNGILRLRAPSSGGAEVQFMVSTANAATATPAGYINYDFTSNNIQFSANSGIQYYMANTGGTGFAPNPDNTKTLGLPSLRWTTVYATTGAINTSDKNQKQDVADLTVAELATAKAIKGLFKTFKFKDAVEKKGADARIHVGVIAQDVQAAFIANGLDANNYGLFCSDTWYVLDGERVPKETDGAVEVTQLGVRYEELLAFVIAAL